MASRVCERRKSGKRKKSSRSKCRWQASGRWFNSFATRDFTSTTSTGKSAVTASTAASPSSVTVRRDVAEESSIAIVIKSCGLLTVAFVHFHFNFPLRNLYSISFRCHSIRSKIDDFRFTITGSQCENETSGIACDRGVKCSGKVLNKNTKRNHKQKKYVEKKLLYRSLSSWWKWSRIDCCDFCVSLAAISIAISIVQQQDVVRQRVISAAQSIFSQLASKHIQ